MWTSAQVVEFVGITENLLSQLVNKGFVRATDPARQGVARGFSDEDVKALAILMALRTARCSRPWDEIREWVEVVDRGPDTPLVSYHFDTRTKKMVGTRGEIAMDLGRVVSRDRDPRRYTCTISLPIGEILRDLDRRLRERGGGA